MKIIRQYRHRYFLTVDDAILSFLTYAHNNNVQTMNVAKFTIAKKLATIEFTKRYQRRPLCWFDIIPYNILLELIKR